MNEVTLRNSAETWFRVALLFAGFAAVTATFYGAIETMVARWAKSEEYGYAFLIPPLVAFFIWQKKNELASLDLRGSWVGLVVVVLGFLLYLLGELATLYVIVQYAFIVVLWGLVIAFLGWKAFRLLLAPLALLIFMVPLPAFIFNNLSQQLQFISSELGVAVIRAFGVSVYLEGNVIDLGSYKLQVVEACSGLRYLFPLAALSYMAAYIFKGAFWKKAIIFLSSAPITVFMNSFRIGVIGVLVDKWGSEQAEGFLHYFEGWVIFMACMAILIFEMWLLSRVGRDRRPFADAFAIEFPEPLEGGSVLPRKVPAPFLASLGVLVVGAALSFGVGQREEIIPERADFDTFPLVVGEWKGKPDRIEQIYLDVLKLDDYLMTDFVRPDGAAVNFYVAYYGSQRKGESAHSPRSCLPGGGWLIKDFDQTTIDGVEVSGTPLRVNRVIIRKGDYTQLVYYWFQQRGRVITNEYLVKWFLFWDALTRHRTDGALVRLTVLVPPGEDIADADRQLTEFAREISSLLPRYIPG